jgi:hypothetical protein
MMGRMEEWKIGRVGDYLYHPSIQALPSFHPSIISLVMMVIMVIMGIAPLPSLPLLPVHFSEI